MSGQRVDGRYRILEPLAHGRHLAQDDLVGGRRWLRFLDQAPARSPALEGRLHHPSLQVIHACRTQDRRTVVVSEALDGRTLHELGTPNPDVLARIGQEALAGLEALARLGLSHGGLSAERILIEQASGSVKLLEVGLPRPANGPRAPEVDAGGAPDSRSDLYELGACLYQAASGRAPDRPPIPLGDLRPELPSGLTRALTLLLEEDPRVRAADETLDAVRTGFGGSATTALPPTVEPRFVGRTDLFRRLEQAVADAQAAASAGRAAREQVAPGAAPLLLVEGGEGLGKSRLLRVAADLLADRGIRPLLASGLAGRDPWALWRQVVNRAERWSSDAELTTRAQAALGSADTDEAIRHEHVTRLLLDLAARRPLVLLIDDAHLLAPPAVALLMHLARAAASPDALGPLVIVLAALPGSDLTAVLDEPGAPLREQLELSELTGEESRALVGSMLSEAEANEVERLSQLGGGNPFLLVELTHEWRLGGGTPASVLETVNARLARLAPEARALLEALAVVGRPLLPETLRRLADDPAQVDAHLRELSGQGVLTVDAEGHYGFRHQVSRQVLQDALGEEALQARCARALDALRDDPAASDGERARLALAAGSPDASTLALAAAPTDPAPEELYQGAIDQMPAGPERALAQQELAERYLRQGAFADARRALEGARDDLGPEPEPLALARVCLAQGRVASAEGDTHEALQWAGRGSGALSQLEPRPAEAGPILAELSALEAQVATIRGDHQGAARLYARAKGLMSSVDGDDPALRTRLQLREAGAIVLSLDRTRFAEAEELIASARASAAERGDEQGELDALRSLGNLAWYSGDVALAEQRFREALTLSERLANLNLAAGLLNNLGMMAQAQGQLSQAEANLERCLDLAERTGQTSVLCRAYTNVGRVRRSLGDVRGAERSLRRAARVARASGDPMIESAALSELGNTRLSERRTKAALRALRRSHRLRLRLGDAGRVAESELELGELWRAGGDVRAALGCTVRAIALLAALGDRDGLSAAVEALEFAVGRPGGPVALLAAARRKLDRERAPRPVRDRHRRGLILGELALRTLAAATAARAADIEQAATHAERAQRAYAQLAASDLDASVIALGAALAHEARATVLAARGEPDAARAAIDEAVAAAEPAPLRTAALQLKRAFLSLALREPQVALKDLAASRPGDDKLSAALAERRSVGRALVAAWARRAGATASKDDGPTRSLAEAKAIATRLGDVALLAMVATARADAAATSGSPQEAAHERAAARLAASRLAEGLPESLRAGLQRQAAPVVEEEAAPLVHAPDQNQLLAMLTRVLDAGLEPTPLLQASLDALLTGTGARRGVAALATDDTEGDDEGPRILAARGADLEALRTQAGYSSTRAVIEHVTREGITVLLSDAGARGSRFAKGRGTPRSVLAVPIKSSGKILGVLYLDDPSRAKRFGAEERSLVGAFASTISGSLAAALRRESKLSELSRLAEAYKETARELGSDETNRELVGRSPAMRSIHRLIERYGRTAAPVTIHGESGTGKELVARALHRASPRKDGPFIVLNCTAVAATLLESELFGIEKGAFTGADRSRKGLFELAHEGTLFLDEVGDMSLDMQAKLLRVLETGELRPVGGRALVKVDVRIVSATHHDLRARVAEGAFREDLLYRLNVLRVELPPLRDRREDIVTLCERFLLGHAERTGEPARQLTSSAIEALMRHSFPGNVRELKNVIERACVLEPSREIGPDRLLLEAPVSGAPPLASSSRAAPDYHKTFEYRGVALNRRQQTLLDHMTDGSVPSVTNREYCALVSVSERTGLRDLTHLVEAGILRRIGRRKGARYEVVSS